MYKRVFVNRYMRVTHPNKSKVSKAEYLNSPKVHPLFLPVLH